MPERSGVTLLDHPLVQHKLTRLRDRRTAPDEFRRLAREISWLLAYEMTRDLRLAPVPIDTPLEPMLAPMLASPPPCLVSILRAGNGLVDAMLDLMPAASVGHIGIYRDPATLQAVVYYVKLPDELAGSRVLLVDPMLATGNSACAAVARLKQAGVAELRFGCLLAAPEGIANLTAAHPDVAIFTAAIDRGLDDHGYIRPGLGDAGDRLFGTG
jgi:uracil phosphoribosyltransferase